MEHRLRIVRDDDASNPRTDCDNPSTLLCWSRHVEGDTRVNADNYETLEELRKQEIPRDAYVAPVYAYVHSGVALSLGAFGCQFDSGIAGLIYMTHADAKENFGEDHTEEQIHNCFTAELAEYEAWIGGDAWGFVLEKVKTCDSCGNTEYEEEDSCWGFLGDAKEAIRDHIPEEHTGLLEKAWDDRA